jgi:hypothetical protein
MKIGNGIKMHMNQSTVTILGEVKQICFLKNNQQLDKASINNRQRMQDLTKKIKKKKKN